MEELGWSDRGAESVTLLLLLLILEEQTVWLVPIILAVSSVEVHSVLRWHLTTLSILWVRVGLHVNYLRTCRAGYSQTGSLLLKITFWSHPGLGWNPLLLLHHTFKPFDFTCRDGHTLQNCGGLAVIKGKSQTRSTWSVNGVCFYFTFCQLLLPLPSLLCWLFPW